MSRKHHVPVDELLSSNFPGSTVLPPESEADMPMTYKRGSKTINKRVARLEPGDIILVRRGRWGYLRDEEGKLVLDENGRSVWGLHDQHIPGVIHSARGRKTNALLAEVKAVHQAAPSGERNFQRAVPAPRVVETELGNLVVPGTVAVTVLLEEPR